MNIGKKIGYLLVIMLGIACIWNCQTIKYGIGQAKGQFKILKEAVPVEQLLADKNTPDSVKSKLLVIEDIRKFAMDSLGLKNSKNYRKMYDQKGKPILWVVIASDKYALNPKKWKFPIIGEFEYKGYFEYDKAENLANELINQGYDTEINEVAAWSTLGWFKDPILSSMLQRTEGALADLIIHELTHSTIFIKNNHKLSENLANYIGEQGAILYLKSKYGLQSTEYQKFINDNQFGIEYNKALFEWAKSLDSFYKSEAFLQSNEKHKLKTEYLDSLAIERHSLLAKFQRKSKLTESPNNAYYIGFLTYNAQQNEFEAELKNKFNGNFKLHLNNLIQRYNQ